MSLLCMKVLDVASLCWQHRQDLCLFSLIILTDEWQLFPPLLADRVNFTELIAGRVFEARLEVLELLSVLPLRKCVDADERYHCELPSLLGLHGTSKDTNTQEAFLLSQRLKPQLMWTPPNMKAQYPCDYDIIRPKALLLYAERQKLVYGCPLESHKKKFKNDRRTKERRQQ